MLKLDTVEDLVLAGNLESINFIEIGCGPIMVEVAYRELGDSRQAILHKDNGEQVMFQNLAQGYELCRRIGVNQANLIQIETHDEAANYPFADYHKVLTPLKF